MLQLGYDLNSKDLKLHNTTQGYTYVNLLVNLQGDVMLVQRALILLQRHTVCLSLTFEQTQPFHQDHLAHSFYETARPIECVKNESVDFCSSSRSTWLP